MVGEAATTQTVLFRLQMKSKRVHPGGGVGESATFWYSVASRSVLSVAADLRD